MLSLTVPRLTFPIAVGWLACTLLLLAGPVRLNRVHEKRRQIHETPVSSIIVNCTKTETPVLNG